MFTLSLSISLSRARSFSSSQVFRKVRERLPGKLQDSQAALLISISAQIVELVPSSCGHTRLRVQRRDLEMIAEWCSMR